LTLSKETLRTLDEQELSLVVGGSDHHHGHGHGHGHGYGKTGRHGSCNADKKSSHSSC
jgi:hypothetical protein